MLNTSIPLTNWCVCDKAYIQGLVAGAIYMAFIIGILILIYHLYTVKKAGEELDGESDD
jgi:hypothetical protein